jgi:5-methyltetrahydropteroyltriglutamate--homocysteine methyltransferase
MPDARPPFHADHVGSLLRPDYLIAARQKFLAGTLAKEELQPLEDRAVREVVAMQEEIGLRVVTDGEFGRNSYLTGFLNPIGVDLQQRKSDDLVYHDDAHGTTVPGTKAFVTSRIKWPGSLQAEAFKFLKATTKQTPKVTLPAPTQAHFFAGRDGISNAVYPDIEQFWDDIIAAYHAEMRALGDAGCTYVQIDETCMPKLADPTIQQAIAGRGQDWRALLAKYADVINRVIAGAPAGMHIAIHHCRGNNAGLWQAQAGYDAVAEIIFGGVKAKAYLLEYDTPRAGDFAPLRFMPKDKFAMLGLISTKSNRVEDEDELKRRIDQAAKYLPLDRLGLGPQCGFSCGFQGSPMTYDAQLKKLERIVEVSRDVWGTA